MKKFIFVLFEMLAFVIKAVIFFGLIIIGIDLISRSMEKKTAADNE